MTRSLAILALTVLFSEPRPVAAATPEEYYQAILQQTYAASTLCDSVAVTEADAQLQIAQCGTSIPALAQKVIDAGLKIGIGQALAGAGMGFWRGLDNLSRSARLAATPVHEIIVDLDDGYQAVLGGDADLVEVSLFGPENSGHRAGVMWLVGSVEFTGNTGFFVVRRVL